MTFEQYADGQDWLSTMFDEMYWDGGLDTEVVFEAVCQEAAKEGVVLTDVDTVDYDKVIYEFYKCTEVGCS